MALSHLKACPACACHVRVIEASCPFCGAELSAEFRASQPPKPPMARLSRAALYAVGASTISLASACSSSVTPAYDASAPVVDAAYGGPPHDAADPVVDAAYGGPPQD